MLLGLILVIGTLGALFVTFGGLTGSVNAQDFADTQRFSNKVLFAKEDEARQRQLAERRHLEELDQRSQQQATLLQQQAVAVQQLGSNLEQMRNERLLLDAASDFDSALLARRWYVARTFLADEITVDLAAQPFPGELTIAADEFVAKLSTYLAGGSILPRASQRVRIDGDQATLTADGYAWSGAKQPKGRPGSFEYRFRHAADGWKLVGLTFRPAS